MTGIPYSDCFSVETRWDVVPVGPTTPAGASPAAAAPASPTAGSPAAGSAAPDSGSAHSGGGSSRVTVRLKVPFSKVRWRLSKAPFLPGRGAAAQTCRLACFGAATCCGLDTCPCCPPLCCFAPCRKPCGAASLRRAQSSPRWNPCKSGSRWWAEGPAGGSACVDWGWGWREPVVVEPMAVVRLAQQPPRGCAPPAISSPLSPPVLPQASEKLAAEPAQRLVRSTTAEAEWTALFGG